MTATARWTPGDDLALVWPGGAAVIAGSVPVEAVERIWTTLQREPNLGVFLQELAASSGTGLLDLPDFAVAVMSGEQCHVAVRGGFTVDVNADTFHQLSGEGITTWAEKMFPSVSGVRLASSPQGGTTIPIVSGVVPAGVIQWGETADAPATSFQTKRRIVSPPPPTDFAQEVVAEEAPSLPAEQQEPDADQTPDESPDPAHSEPEPQAADEGAETLAEDDLSQEVESPEFDDFEALAPQPQTSDESGPAPDLDAPTATPRRAGSEEPPDENNESAQPKHAEPDEYASLWGNTIGLDLEAAAIRETDGEEEIAPTPKASANVDDQRDGDTIADPGMVAISMSGGPSSSAPQVLSRFCDRGHANPPERGTCFVCQGQVSGDAMPADRPQLGWLRVEGGETIPIKGPIIAGRNPKSTALRTDEAPRLLALPHPHVSSNHIAFILEGWRILARDLRSSNGSYLRRHGKPPVRLPEHPVPLVPGDLIDLGKGIFIHLERTP